MAHCKNGTFLQLVFHADYHQIFLFEPYRLEHNE